MAEDSFAKEVRCLACGWSVRLRDFNRKKSSGDKYQKKI